MKKNLLPILMTGMLMVFSANTWAQIVMLVQEPANLAGSYGFTYSSNNNWGADMDTVAITAEVAFAYDGTVADSLGCEEIVNSADIAGKIAILYRATCNFSLKAHNVQDSGAVACIIINNVPGGPVGMGAGTNSAGVVIPVVMISDVDGAALRDSILAGAVTVFLGNNTGLFANNVGSYRPNVGMANSFAIPSPFALSSTGFEVPIASWVFNYGSAEAVNVAVNTVIDRDGTEVYNETSTGSNIPVGDSLLFTLPTYSENGYAPGYYTITYTLSSDNSDEFPDDNVVEVNFWINDEGMYSKSRIDPVDGPLGTSGLRPANSTEFQWCTSMLSENASAMLATGVSFNAVTNEDIELKDQVVQVSFYEWGDDLTAGLTFDILDELTDNDFYEYPTDSADAADLQSEFVTYDFPTPFELTDEQKYLMCVTIFVDNMFLGTDPGLDYNTTYDSYPDEVFFPLNADNNGDWFGGGFGPDNTPAIITNLVLVNGIAEDINEHDVTPYPNPTMDMINIPFGTALAGTVNLEVFDVTGRSVMSEELFLKNSHQLRVDVTALSSGLHTFNLTFEDDSHTSFRVVITK